MGADIPCQMNTALHLDPLNFTPLRLHHYDSESQCVGHGPLLVEEPLSYLHVVGRGDLRACHA